MTDPLAPIDPLAMTPEEELLAIQEGSMLPPSEAPPYGDLPVGEFDPSVPVDPAPLPVPVPEVEPELSEEDRLRQRLGHKRGIDILLSGASGGKKYGLADQAKTDLESHLKSKLTAIKGPKYVTADNKPIYVEGGTNYIRENGKMIPYEGAMHIPKQMHDPAGTGTGTGTAKVPPFVKKLDEAAGKELSAWVTEGSSANEGVVNTVDHMISLLKNPETAPSKSKYGRMAVGLISDTGLAPDTADQKQTMAGLTVKKLKDALGHQFTENESKMMMKIDFDHTLPTKIKIKRLNIIRAVAQHRREQMDDMIRWVNDPNNNNSIMGYTPLTMSDEHRAAYDNVEDWVGKVYKTPYQEAISKRNASRGNSSKAKQAAKPNPARLQLNAMKAAAAKARGE